MRQQPHPQQPPVVNDVPDPDPRHVTDGTPTGAAGLPPARRSTAELVAQLAQIEDAIRATPTFTSSADDGTAPLNPDLLALAARERDIIAQLRHPVW